MVVEWCNHKDGHDGSWLYIVPKQQQQQGGRMSRLSLNRIVAPYQYRSDFKRWKEMTSTSILQYSLLWRLPAVIVVEFLIRQKFPLQPQFVLSKSAHSENTCSVFLEQYNGNKNKYHRRKMDRKSNLFWVLLSNSSKGSYICSNILLSSACAVTFRLHTLKWDISSVTNLNRQILQARVKRETESLQLSYWKHAVVTQILCCCIIASLSFSTFS